MARFEEMLPRGRRVRGPISDVVELVGKGGRRFHAIAFHDGFRDDPALSAGLAVVREFLELPMVDGLAPLRDLRRGVAAYETPEIRTVRELIGVFAEEGGGGPKAALELLWRGATVLAEAAEVAGGHGLRSHGSLDPWRIGVTPDGAVVVLGYGLPPLDVLAFMKDERQLPQVDSLRYCPPERLEGEAEDRTSDLYALCLAAVELCTGRPVYPGNLRAVLDAAGAGDAPELLGAVPRSLQAVVRQALQPYAHQRHADPRRLVEQARAAAASAEGRSLAELVRDGAQYLSDVEEDLPAGMTIADLVGAPPKDARLVEAQERAARAAERAAAAREGLEEPPAVDDALPDVASALGRADEAARALDEAAEEAARAGAAAGSAGERSVAEAAATRAEQAADRAEEAAATVRSERALAVRAAEAARKRAEAEQEKALREAAARIEEAERALEAFGEELEEADARLGAARAAMRKAQVARGGRNAERASARASEAALEALAVIRAAVAERERAEAERREAEERAEAERRREEQEERERVERERVERERLERERLERERLERERAEAERRRKEQEERERLERERLERERAEAERRRKEQEERERLERERAEAERRRKEQEERERLERERAEAERRRKEQEERERLERERAEAERRRAEQEERERAARVAAAGERVARARARAEAAARRWPVAAVGELVGKVPGPETGGDPTAAEAAAARSEGLAAEIERAVDAGLARLAALAPRLEELKRRAADADLSEVLRAVDPAELDPDALGAALDAAARDLEGHLAERARRDAEAARAARETLAEARRRTEAALKLGGVDEALHRLAERAQGLLRDTAAQGTPTGRLVEAAAELARIATETEARARAVVAEREARVRAARERAALALARAEAAHGDREEPELALYAEDARTAAAELDATTDPDRAEALLRRAEATADAAEQLLAEILAEEAQIRAAAVAALRARGRRLAPRLEALAREEAVASERSAASARLAELEAVGDPSAGERLLAEAEQLVARGEERATALAAERERARRAALEALRARGQAALARLHEGIRGHDDAELSSLRAEADEVLGDLSRAEPGPGDALAARIEALAGSAMERVAALVARRKEAVRARAVELRRRLDQVDGGDARAAALLDRSGFADDPVEAERLLAEAGQAIHDAEQRAAAERQRVAAERQRVAAARARAERAAEEVRAAEVGSTDVELALHAADAAEALEELAACADAARAEALAARLEAGAEAARQRVVEILAEQARLRDAARAAVLVRARALRERLASVREDHPDVRGALTRASAKLADLERADDPGLAERLLTEAEHLVGRAADRAAALAAERERIRAVIASLRARADTAVARAREVLADEPDPELRRHLADAAEAARELAACEDRARADVLAARATRTAEEVVARAEALAAERARRRAALEALRERAAAAVERAAELVEGEEDAEVQLHLEDAREAVRELASSEDPAAAEALVARASRSAEESVARAEEVAAERAAAVVAGLGERAARALDDAEHGARRWEDPGLAAHLARGRAALADLRAEQDVAGAERLAEAVARAVEGMAARARELHDELLDGLRAELAALSATLDDTIGGVADPELDRLADEGRALGSPGPEADEVRLEDLAGRLQALVAAAEARRAVLREAERRRRVVEEAVARAAAAWTRAATSRWLDGRAADLARIREAQARVAEADPEAAQGSVEALERLVDELESAARAAAADARADAAVADADAAVRDLPGDADEAPEDVRASLAVAREAVGRIRRARASLDRMPIDRKERAIEDLSAAAGTTRALAEAALASWGEWRRARRSAAVERAAAALDRARAAEVEAASIRASDELTEAVVAAVEAASAASATEEAALAEGHAARAEASADRAEEALGRLHDEVRASITALTRLQALRDEAENLALTVPAPAAHELEAELHRTWSRAEHAARRADREGLAGVSADLSALVERIRARAREASEPARPSLVSLSERVRAAEQDGGKAVLVGPTLSPDDLHDEPTLRPGLPPAVPPTLTPDDPVEPPEDAPDDDWDDFDAPTVGDLPSLPTPRRPTAPPPSLAPAASLGAPPRPSTAAPRPASAAPPVVTSRTASPSPQVPPAPAKPATPPVVSARSSKPPTPPPPPPLPPPTAQGPTLTPAEEQKARSQAKPPETRRPSVAELQARLRARASRRGSSEPPEEQDPDAVTQRGWPELEPGAPADVFGTPAAPPPRAAPPSGASTAPTAAPRQFGEAPTVPRPIQRSVSSEARTTLMSKEQLEAIVRAAAEEDDEDEARTTMFRPSDFGAEDDDDDE